MACESYPLTIWCDKFKLIFIYIGTFFTLVLADFYGYKCFIFVSEMTCVSKVFLPL